MSRVWHGLPGSIGPSGLSALWRRHVGVPGRNRLRNGGCIVNQRNPGAAYTDVSTFDNGANAPILDFWKLQADGADRADVSQELTVVPTGSYAAILLDAETLTASPAAEKFGILQVIESRDCIDLRSGTCSVQFKARVGGAANISNIRAAVVEWTGTVDAPTLPIAAAAAWGAEGANPTLAASWAYISTPANIAMTTAYQTFTIEAVPVGATANNLALFIWVDDKDTVAGSFLYLADLKLESGPYATRFEVEDFTDTLIAAGRRFRKTFPYLTVPASSAGVAGGLYDRADPEVVVRAIWNWEFPFSMRVAGALATYNPSAGGAQARDITGGSNLSISSTTITERNLFLTTNDLDATYGDICVVHATIDSEF